MHDQPAGRRPAVRNVRVVLLAAAAMVAMAVTSAPARADTTLAVIHDSVIVSGQPSGPTTVQVTRPDALTGNPVVIGLFSGLSDGVLPFTVNTTNATALNPDGDCWQKGALAQALTPDLRPGDTVTLTGDPNAPGGTTPASVVVPADDGSGSGGPIPSCESIAPFASNAVTGAPQTVTGGPIAISGVAQPLATDVAAAVTDGTHSTVPVHATPGADGTWSATIPADQAGTLANGPLTAGAVFAVPDVATGALAHIAGAPIALQMAHAAAPAAGATSSRPPRARPNAKRPVSGTGRAPSRISLSRAGGGLRATLVVSKGAHVLDVRLLRGKRTLVHRVVRAGRAGTRQTVVITRRAPSRGRYTVAVRSGPSRAHLSAPVLRTIRVR